MVSKLAGTLTKEKIDVKKLEQNFWNPGTDVAPVKFGTSGHRGELGRGFCALHVKAIAQAVARIHTEKKIQGKILVGGDTRLMSRSVAEICAQVLAANGFCVVLPDRPVPTPVFSFEILSGHAVACLNGTASHNPPQDMGLKYNPSTGGPADSALTGLIEKYANQYLQDPSKIKEIPLQEAMSKGLIENSDIITPYITALGKKIDFDAIANCGQKFAVHPLGGTSLAFYQAIKAKYQLTNMDIVSTEIDPTFYFIPIDHDGKIRMDPSSKYPMATLLDVVEGGGCPFAGASDPDADRFGCATQKGGLIPPNHALCVMAEYLIRHHRVEGATAIGRTLGTTSLLDRIAKAHHLKLEEVNVGFKYFVPGLIKHTYVLAGEESAGMSVGDWTTEKDGIFAVFLLMEIQAKEGDIFDLYNQLTERYGTPYYTRVDVPTDEDTKKKIKSLKAADFKTLTEVCGETVQQVRDTDGIKIYLQDSWFLVRPSGTENILKIYAETYKSPEHLEKIIEQAQQILK